MRNRDHRYIFLLYNQSKPLLPIEEQIAVKSNERIDRRKFNVAAFVEQNGLELVGANFFLVSPLIHGSWMELMSLLQCENP